MTPPETDRRRLLSALIVVPFGEIVRVAPAVAQTGVPLPPIVQPAEKTKAGFLARARALRDQAVKEGDQAYGAVVVRDGVIVGEGRTTSSCVVTRQHMPSFWAVCDAARRLNKRDLSGCDVYSTATPCPMCQGALYWARIRRYHNDATPEAGVAPKLAC